MNNYGNYNNFYNCNTGYNGSGSQGGFYPPVQYSNFPVGANTLIPAPPAASKPRDEDIKRLKKYSNAITVPLVLTQVVAVFVVISALLAYIAIQTVILHHPVSTNMVTSFTDSISGNNNDVISNTLNTLIYFCYMFIPFMIIAAVLKQNPLKVIPFKPKKRSFMVPAIIVGVFLSVIGEFYSDYFNMLLGFFHVTVNLPEFTFPNNIPAQVVYFIQVSIFAPFCEEFIFRGIILTNLRKYGNLFAVIVSSVMFGILHGNFAQTPFAFLVGVGLAVAVIETGSVWTSITIHFIVNGSSTVFSALTFYIGDFKANIIYGVYMGIAVLLFIGVLIMLKRKKLYSEIFGHYSAAKGSTPARNVPALVRAFTATPGCIIFIIFFCLTMFLSLKPV